VILDQKISSNRFNKNSPVISERQFTSGLLLKSNNTSLKLFNSKREAELYIENILKACLFEMEENQRNLLSCISLFPAVVFINGNNEICPSYLGIIGLTLREGSDNNSDSVSLRQYDENEFIRKDKKFSRTSFYQPNNILFNLTLFIVRKKAIHKIIPWDYIPSDLILNFKEMLETRNYISKEYLTSREIEIREKLVTKQFNIWG
jgi:hypothetical protein